MEKRKNTPEYLTARSVKETLDARMDGICYASMEGQPILVNRQMNEICGYLFQTEIMNANDFWEDLQNIQTSEKAEVIRNEPSSILRFSDTKVWNFFEKRGVHERYFVSGNYSIRYRRAVPAESGAEG